MMTKGQGASETSPEDKQEPCQQPVVSQLLVHHCAQHITQPHCSTSPHAQAGWPSPVCHIITNIARQRCLRQPLPHPASHETSQNGSGESTGAYPCLGLPTVMYKIIIRLLSHNVEIWCASVSLLSSGANPAVFLQPAATFPEDHKPSREEHFVPSTQPR